MKLRSTRIEDLDFVYSLEHDKPNERFITPWEKEQHRRLLDSNDTFHAVILDNGDRPVGYLFVNGLQRDDRVLELKRLVVADKGHGFGRFAVRQVKNIAFNEWNARRLWLDVRDFNETARCLYESEGFRLEGKGAENLLIYGISTNETPLRQGHSVSAHLDLVTRFMDAYRYVGAPSADVPPGFLYHASPELVHPSLTPCFVKPKVTLTASMLTDLVSVVPFFSVVDGPWCEMSAIRAIAAESGWVQKYRVMSVEFLTVVTDATEVDDYLFDVGDAHAEPSLIERTNRLGAEVFGMPPEMAAALTTIAKVAEDKVYAVIARESDGGDVAAGLAFCRDRTAFLAGGAVREQHRCRGLWHQLLRRRQLLTETAGADLWIYTTVNPYLVGQGDVRMDLITFAKSEVQTT